MHDWWWINEVWNLSLFGVVATSHNESFCTGTTSQIQHQRGHWKPDRVWPAWVLIPMNLTSWQQEHLAVCDSLYKQNCTWVVLFSKALTQQNGIIIGRWCIFVGFLQKVVSYSVGQEIVILGNQEIHCHIHNSMPLDPVLSPMNLVNICTPYLFKIFLSMFEQEAFLNPEVPRSFLIQLKAHFLPCVELAADQLMWGGLRHIASPYPVHCRIYTHCQKHTTALCPTFSSGSSAWVGSIWLCRILFVPKM